MKERDIVEIIDQIILKIPKTGYERLISRLSSFKSSALYSPPESMHYWWDTLSITLNSELNYPPITEWQKEVYKIITMKDFK